VEHMLHSALVHWNLYSGRMSGMSLAGACDPFRNMSPVRAYGPRAQRLFCSGACAAGKRLQAHGDGRRP
jgi:hypothetical protein